MDSKLYLTVAAIVAIIYGLGFVLIPSHLVALYGMTPEPHLVLNIRFFGTTLIALGVIFWFARDVREWAAVRGVLIGAIVGDALGVLVNLWGTMKGLLNGLAWSSTVVYIALLVGAIYCLSTGAEARSSWPKRSVRAREHGPSTLRPRDSSPGLPSPAIQ
jgi:uncharacterized membrane protein YfcA